MKPFINIYGGINVKEVLSIKNFVIMAKNTTREAKELQEEDVFRVV
jgi:hypothetical protein